MADWNIVLGMLVYFVLGLAATEVTYLYLKRLEKDVNAIDERYSSRLYFAVNYKNNFNKVIKIILLWTVWPIVCIACIIKAEWEYDVIVRHSVKRAP